MIIKSNRERIEEHYYLNIMSAIERTELNYNLRYNQIFYNIPNNKIEFLDRPWHLIEDYRIRIYIGKLTPTTMRLEDVALNFFLDINLNNFSKRNMLSIYPELISEEDIWNKILSLNSDEFTNYNTYHNHYNTTTSVFIHKLCTNKLKTIINMDEGFLMNAPELMFANKFLIPGWTEELVLKVLNQILELKQMDFWGWSNLAIDLGGLIGENEKIHPTILDKIDEELTKYFENIYKPGQETQTELYLNKMSPINYFLKNLVLTQEELNQGFQRFKELCKKLDFPDQVNIT